MLKLIYVLSLLTICTYPQTDSSDLIINHFNNFQFLKTKKVMTEVKQIGDLIIVLDTFHVQYTKNKYFIWQNLPLSSLYKMPILDADNNGKLEFYGTQISNDTSKGYIFELNNIPKFLYRYDGPLRNFYDVGSIKGDGIKNLVGVGNYNRMLFYKQSSANSLVKEPDFIYNLNSPIQQPENLTFYDIDGDGIQELIYYIYCGEDSIWNCSNHIAKYNPLINNYKLVYYDRPMPDFYTFGILTGDFDNDGKGNFATGSIDGKAYVYEHVNGINYNIEFQKQMECHNLYLQGYTHDMDGNGKPELWIGGDFASSTYGGVTRIFGFEPSGITNYEQVYQIDIRGLFTLTIGCIRVADFDNDGKEEIMIKNGSYIFFIKNRGIKNYYCDFIYQDPMSDTLARVYEWGADAKDLDYDGIPELLSFNTVGADDHPTTLILKRSPVVGISDEENSQPNQFKLFQNYPNPFNPSSQINFSIPQAAFVQLNIYDAFGREIEKLVEGFLPAGNHSSQFTAKNLASGTYFYTLKSGNFTATKKMILIK